MGWLGSLVLAVLASSFGALSAHPDGLRGGSVEGGSSSGNTRDGARQQTLAGTGRELRQACPPGNQGAACLTYSTSCAANTPRPCTNCATGYWNNQGTCTKCLAGNQGAACKQYGTTCTASTKRFMCVTCNKGWVPVDGTCVVDPCVFTPGPSAPYNQCGPYGGCAYDYQAPKLVVEGQLSYTCKCPAPTLYWNGKECLRDPCFNSACGQGGTCIRSGNDRICKCPGRASVLRWGMCFVACDKTSPVPWCMPYDTCVPGPSFGLDFSCYRTQGGISAQMIQAPVGCPMGCTNGQCTTTLPVPGQTVCGCPPGWSIGSDGVCRLVCDTARPCGEGNVCVPSMQGPPWYRCTCLSPPGATFDGVTCDLNECADKVKFLNGTVIRQANPCTCKGCTGACVNLRNAYGTGSYRCTCKDGWANAGTSCVKLSKRR